MRKLSFVVMLIAMSLINAIAYAQNEIAKTNAVVQSEAVEIPVHELPDQIIAVITSNFTEHTQAQAFKTVKDEKEFYLVTYTKEDVIEKVIFNSEGKVIKKKNTIL